LVDKHKTIKQDRTFNVRHEEAFFINERFGENKAKSKKNNRFKNTNLDKI
jgi:hypothetical protein